MNRRWICSDVWMDILPSFDHAQLGLKMALLSPRFDALIDAHFDGKSELTLWRPIGISKGIGPKPEMFVRTVGFPLPERPLPNKIRFKSIYISYIDHSVIEFLRSNKQIWDRNGTDLEFNVHIDEIKDVQPIWDVFTHEIWPVFATNIRHLYFSDGDQLDNLRRRTSPTLLTDLDQLHSMESGFLCPDGIADDGPKATAGQALAKWLHTPTKDGQPKRLRYFNSSQGQGWINKFKKTFIRATDCSVSYKIYFDYCGPSKLHLKPFELVNEQTKEKLTLMKKDEHAYWMLKRCPIIVGETTATDQWEDDEKWDDNLNNVKFDLSVALSQPTAGEEKEDEEAA